MHGTAQKGVDCKLLLHIRNNVADVKQLSFFWTFLVKDVFPLYSGLHLSVFKPNFLSKDRQMLII